MPELCEVEIICRFLKKKFVGQRIVHVEVLDPTLRYPVRENYAQCLEGGIICDIMRHGKYLVWKLQHALCKEVLFHLGMTGRLLEHTNGLGTKHLKIFYVFNSHKLYFYDVRRFAFTLAGEDLLQESKLGPDALSIGKRQFHKLFHSSRAVKDLLLQQEKIAGIGNIYANEILFAAGIHPEQKANTLNEEQIEKLYYAMRSVLHKAIKKGGSTISDFYYGPGKRWLSKPFFGLSARK